MGTRSRHKLSPPADLEGELTGYGLISSGYWEVHGIVVVQMVGPSGPCLMQVGECDPRRRSRGPWRPGSGRSA